MTYHVIPNGDLKPHDESVHCWCGPVLDDECDIPVYVHNSMDGREAFETGERLPS